VGQQAHQGLAGKLPSVDFGFMMTSFGQLAILMVVTTPDASIALLYSTLPVTPTAFWCRSLDLTACNELCAIFCRALARV
jgi:hypothetical protein